MREPRARRSELATPASSEQHVREGGQRPAPTSCSSTSRTPARRSAKESAPGPSRWPRSPSQDWGRTVRAVRVNGLDTPWCHGDIIEVVTGAREALDVLIVPEGALGPRRLVGRRPAHPARGQARPDASASALEVLIEEAEGLANAVEIARASDRLEAIIFGAGDLSASLHARVDGNFDPVGDYPGDFWHFARVQVRRPRRGPRASTPSTRRIPPTRTPTATGASAMHASLLGFDGKWAIHPDQIAIANEVFAPDRRRDRRRRGSRSRPTGASEADGVGAIGRDGRLVDAAHMRLAENMLHKAPWPGRRPRTTSVA